MGSKGKSKATVARDQKERMRRRRKEQTAFIELAPPGEEKLLARMLASPCEKNPSNAQGLAPPLGSLSIPLRDMSTNSDSPEGVCTPTRVPSPEGVAGQTKLVNSTPDGVTSIIDSMKKMHEYNSEYIDESNTENFDRNTEKFDENNIKNTKKDVKITEKSSGSVAGNICKPFATDKVLEL